MNIKYHTPVFDNISDEKKNSVLNAASIEFAALGYSAANINVIAKKAGVSIGSIYKYFSTKENLFLTVCALSVTLLTETLDAVMREKGNFFEKIESLLRIIQIHSREQSVMINLYNEITTEGNKDLVTKLTYQMESVSTRCYALMIEEGQKTGFIDPDIDEKTFAFHLDNLLMSLQFSYASEYYKERMKIFIGDDIFADDDKIIQHTVEFIRRAFSPSQGVPETE
ncbi:MAG: TetR/AcrR family transcriptional regulator [Bacteroidetes bacterium]|nr:TetR/AcrR family transcriptional regulator [Bacteroidota bacterium]